MEKSGMDKEQKLYLFEEIQKEKEKGHKMTEKPIKEKIKEAFAENDRLHKELSVAIVNWTTSWDRNCKRIAKMCEEIT